MRVIRSRSPVLLSFAHDFKRARAMPCAYDAIKIGICFLPRNDFFRKRKSEIGNEKWKTGPMTDLIEPILHFPLSISAVQTL
jgi:hypothetical protein